MSSEDLLSTYRFVVYRDSRRYSSWIYDDQAEDLTLYLEQGLAGPKLFKRLDAQQLAQWMERVVSDDKTKDTVVVFSQDAVPNTIMPGPQPNALVRHYLDVGGKIVWIGDIPFYVVATSGQHGADQWKDVGTASILTLVCAKTEGAKQDRVKITKEGSKYGLSDVPAWYSMRPVRISRNLLALATATPENPEFPDVGGISLVTRLVDQLGVISKLAPVLLSIAGLAKLYTTIAEYVSPQEPLDVAKVLSSIVLDAGFWAVVAILFVVGYVVKKTGLRRRKLASSWIREGFCKDRRHGFVRLFDYDLRAVHPVSKLPDSIKRTVYLAATEEA